MKFKTPNIFFLFTAFLVIAPIIEAYALQGFDQDTVFLEQVEVYAPPLDRFTIGQTVKTVDKRVLEEFAGQNLGEVLQQRSGIFVRQYGPGMLASVTMRGAAAGHTAVFWNGIPINSASLGQSDFSILPTNGFDQVTVHHGSSGALYGTDAIGGSIHLNSKLNFGQGSKFSFYQGVGSFGRVNNQLQYNYSNQKIATTTRVYRNFADNNYPYTNRSKFGSPVEIQQHAAIQQHGANQDIGWNVGKKSQLSTSLWWNLTDREIQPVMGSNNLDVQKDQNLRWVADYFHFGTSATWNVKVGAIRDELLFNRRSRNLVTQYFASSDFEKSISEKWETKTGARYTLIEGNLSTYEATDNRLELYHSSNFQPWERFSLSLNLRQLIFEGNFAPFTPSISGKYHVLRKGSHQVDMNGAFARSFKVPTINDRFWVPGGNPDLLSEDSWSSELGAVHTWRQGRAALETQLTVYRMWVDNWIIWLPNGNFWSPTNIRKVENSGVELFINGKYDLSYLKMELQMDYALNRALNQTNISENDRSGGKQLPYTPLHKYQVTGRVIKDKVSGFINTQYISERFIGTDNVGTVAPYQLWNLGGNYQWRLFTRLEGRIGFQMNNILNQEYEVLRLRPMPGRNYQINLNITI